MGKRTSYDPGTFSWVELSTTDPDGAKAFYAELLGWSYEDNPIPGGGAYTLCQLEGVPVAGLQLQQEQQREAGIPPNWFSYVTVDSADECAKRAEELGGSVHVPAFDVMDSGRMAVIGDPAGALFGAWEPRSHIGAQLVNEPGCLTWNELSTDDVAAASAFYSALFGWKIEEIDTGDAPPYWSIGHDGAAAGRNGGIRELAPEQIQGGVPPHWMPYFTVEDTGAAIQQAKQAGGAHHFGPMTVPAGTFSVLSDPQGAFFATFEGDFDD